MMNRLRKRFAQLTISLWITLLVSLLILPAVCQSAASATAQRRRAPASSASKLPLQSFSFRTTKLANNGAVVQSTTGQGQSYQEDLGNGVKLELVKIPGGTFFMGSSESEAEQFKREYQRFGINANDAATVVQWEMPRHRVTVPTFLMAKFEITQAQWKAVFGPNPAYFKGDDLPVEQISWQYAAGFCRELSKRTGKTYRLPSEAEWEYACRAGSSAPFSFGETITADLVNFNGEFPFSAAARGSYRKKTTPVGSLGIANAFGLYDMNGNVGEWCQDTFHPNYQGAPANGSAWETGGDGTRVVRGGCWYSNGNSVRSASRLRFDPTVQINGNGFRVVLEIP